MDDDNGRGNQRRRARHQIDGEEEEDDRSTNRRRQLTNQTVTNDDDDDDNDVPLSLSLGPTPYSSSSSQIIPPMTTTMILAPSPSPFSMSSSPHDFMARYQSYLMTTSPAYLASSSLSNYSLYQTGSRGISMQQQPPPLPPSFTFLPSFDFNPPPARPRSEMMMTPPPVVVVDQPPRRRSQPNGNRKDDTIPPPFPWATNKRGRIQSLEYLESKQITSITGEVHCKHCEKVYQVSYNLRERFSQVENIFLMRKRIMRERAPSFWTSPDPVRCEFCGRDKAVKPVIADRKSQINWLFLLLGQTLGHCTLEQLKNFCKHSKSHRTGAKDRVLYLTYLGLCKMLEPNRELFHRDSSRRP